MYTVVALSLVFTVTSPLDPSSRIPQSGKPSDYHPLYQHLSIMVTNQYLPTLLSARCHEYLWSKEREAVMLAEWNGLNMILKLEVRQPENESNFNSALVSQARPFPFQSGDRFQYAARTTYWKQSALRNGKCLACETNSTLPSSTSLAEVGLGRHTSYWGNMECNQTCTRYSLIQSQSPLHSPCSMGMRLVLWLSSTLTTHRGHACHIIRRQWTGKLYILRARFKMWSMHLETTHTIFICTAVVFIAANFIKFVLWAARKTNHM